MPYYVGADVLLVRSFDPGRGVVHLIGPMDKARSNYECDND